MDSRCPQELLNYSMQVYTMVELYGDMNAHITYTRPSVVLLHTGGLIKTIHRAGFLCASHLYCIAKAGGLGFDSQWLSRHLGLCLC